jgi:hypothetical protein
MSSATYSEMLSPEELLAEPKTRMADPVTGQEESGDPGWTAPIATSGPRERQRRRRRRRRRTTDEQVKAAAPSTASLYSDRE